MATWDLRQLQLSLSKNAKPLSLYLLFGDEDYLITKALSLIQSHSVSSEWREFGVEHFEAPSSI